MDEFELIQTYFQPLSKECPHVLLGIGDDAACLSIPDNMHLLISTDTLVDKVHFLADWNPYDIAYRAVMVNVSDIAAMGGEPQSITLALTLPELNESFVAAFTRGLSAACNAFHLTLIGGDVTAGASLTITIGIYGIVPKHQAITRSKASPGDSIWVSGYLGAAALAISLLDRADVQPGDKKNMMQHILAPQPRVALGMLLRDYASAAIDISDGLASDLRHICDASHVGAVLRVLDIPVHPLVKQYAPYNPLILTLTGGDDYELCFTIPPQKTEAFVKAIKALGHVCYPIGYIDTGNQLRLMQSDGRLEVLNLKGYRHFK